MANVVCAPVADDVSVLELVRRALTNFAAVRDAGDGVGATLAAHARGSLRMLDVAERGECAVIEAGNRVLLNF